MVSLEKELQKYVNEGFLLHGSRIEIKNGFIEPNEGKVFATNNYEIAIMKSIVSSKDLIYPGLVYPYFIHKNSPIELHIYGMNEDTIGANGFIYVIDKEGFKNEPKGSWQYILDDNSVPIIKKIKTSKDDLKIPIFSIK